MPRSAIGKCVEPLGEGLLTEDRAGLRQQRLRCAARARARRAARSRASSRGGRSRARRRGPCRRGSPRADRRVRRRGPPALLPRGRPDAPRPRAPRSAAPCARGAAWSGPAFAPEYMIAANSWNCVARRIVHGTSPASISSLLRQLAGVVPLGSGIRPDDREREMVRDARPRLGREQVARRAGEERDRDLGLQAV